MTRSVRPSVPGSTGRSLREAGLLLVAAVLLAALAWLVRTPRLPLRADPEIYRMELPAPPITPAEGTALYRQGRAIFVDTRPADEVRERIPGSFRLRQASFDADYRQLFQFAAPADSLVLYGDGNLSALAAPASRLSKRGYTHLFLLRGGLRQWRRAGGELAPAFPQPRPGTADDGIRAEERGGTGHE